MRAMYAAASGMTAQQLNVDTIANNLANVNTLAFKRARVEFQDLMYQTLRIPGTLAAEGVEVPTGIQIGLGTRAVATQKIFSQGDFQQTEAPLDMVIQGDGFFALLQTDGTVAYTRAGAFNRSSEGLVVNSDGLPMDPAITIPANALSISIGRDGTVSAQIAGQTEHQVLGQIQLARFANPAGLLSAGDGLYLETKASGTATLGSPGIDGLGHLLQGYLEQSNVEVVQEMVNMIVAQRAYEANSRAIQIADDMLATANSARR